MGKSPSIHYFSPAICLRRIKQSERKDSNDQSFLWDSPDFSVSCKHLEKRFEARRDIVAAPGQMKGQIGRVGKDIAKFHFGCGFKYPHGFGHKSDPRAG